MATIKGTASSPADYMAKLVSFLTTNSDLSAASALWSQAWSASATEVVLKGPGANSGDAVYVGLKLVTSTGTSGGYALAIYGMTGIVSSATGITGHANVSPAVWMYLDNSTMNYWITASGRRFMSVVQISTVFESMYAGWFLPYCDPTYYAAPFVVGGSSQSSASSPQTYRNQNNDHSSFINPYWTSVNQNVSNMQVLLPSGTWASGIGINSDSPSATNVGVGPNEYYGEKVDTNFGVVQGAGTIDNNPLNSFGYANYMPRLVPFYNGTVSLQDVTLTLSTGGTLGVLDGIKRIGGLSADAADTVTVSDLTYIVVQNVYRTDSDSFFAMETN